jgi:hypothetical protein
MTAGTNNACSKFGAFPVVLRRYRTAATIRCCVCSSSPTYLASWQTLLSVAGLDGRSPSPLHRPLACFPRTFIPLYPPHSTYEHYLARTLRCHTPMNTRVREMDSRLLLARTLLGGLWHAAAGAVSATPPQQSRLQQPLTLPR